MDRPEAPLEMREDLYRAYGIPARLVCVPSKAARFASVSRYVSRSRGAQDRLALTEGFWSEEDALRDEFQQYEEGDPDDPLCLVTHPPRSHPRRRTSTRCKTRTMSVRPATLLGSR